MGFTLIFTANLSVMNIYIYIHTEYIYIYTYRIYIYIYIFAISNGITSGFMVT